MTWRRHPYHLVADDPMMVFPAAEGTHPDFGSDTWYLAGYLTGRESGRRFAFITIYNRNRPAPEIVADFHTFAVFDIDQHRYGTCTDYDMPPKNMVPGAVPKLVSAEGHLDLTYHGSAGISSWTACRNDEGELVPYTYDYTAVGTDNTGAAMELRLHLTPTRGPVPVGASVHNGRIVACLQDNTYSYFQTGMQMTGTLRWGDYAEEVTGPSGHIDRQWFPSYAGGGATGGDMRGQAHQWHTITLDNGVDLSVWRQFDRHAGNALVPFTGITATYADGSPPQYVEDLVVTTTSFVRWPDDVRTLVPPPSQARYLPERHRISSAALDLELTGEPLVSAPAHALPIEYLEGPYRYHGSMRGRSVTGLALYEATDARYRDWELIEVLEVQIDYRGVDSAELTSTVAAARASISRHDGVAALEHLDRLRPLLQALPEESSADLVGILDGVVEAIRNEVR